MNVALMIAGIVLYVIAVALSYYVAEDLPDWFIWAAVAVGLITVVILLFKKLTTKKPADILPDDFDKFVSDLDRTLSDLNLTEQQKTEAIEKLTKDQDDLEKSIGVVKGFLEAILLDKNIPPDQYGETFSMLLREWENAGARLDALGRSSPLAPHIEGLRKNAQEAHASGDTIEADRILKEIVAEEEEGEQELLHQQRENTGIAAEIQQSRQIRILTKDVQIALALAGLRYQVAARLIAEKIDLSEEHADKRLALLASEFARFYKRDSDKNLSADLLVAIEIARLILPRTHDSDERASMQNDLGNALRALGERETGTVRLHEAVEAYRAALEARPRERVPLRWAVTQNNLGIALSKLGERESGTGRLHEAIAAYCAALEEMPRERVPLRWAATQNNLGIALSKLGERETGTAHLHEAIAAYRAALGEWSRERVPLYWAMAQNNLGIALQTLGKRETGTELLHEAIAAYRAALEEWTRERVPLYWAGTQSNLSEALRVLGEREASVERLHEAVAASRAALEESIRERVPLDWAKAQNSLGEALQALGERETGTERLFEAVVAYRAALEERTRERAPLDWARTQNNLGAVLSMLGRRETGTEHLHEAVAAHRAALEEWTRERMPLQWAATQNNLGIALRALGERETGTERLLEAVEAYCAALEEMPRERVPLQWATTQNNLGTTLRALGQRENGTDCLKKALAAWEDCLTVTEQIWSPDWNKKIRSQSNEARAEIARRSSAGSEKPHPGPMHALRPD